MISPVSHIIVGVADMAPVRELWQEQLGFVVVAESTGSDPDLERAWGLPAAGVTEQLLLQTPGVAAGQLHFVRFADPAAAVRAGAAVTDLCPKNIDINCRDLSRLVERLGVAGYEFRSDISEYEIDGVRVSEVQMPAHDDINVVLLQVPDWQMPMTACDCGGVTTFVTTVNNTKAEAEFFATLFGHEQVMHHRISGPEIETVIGLPPGAAIDLRVTGSPENLFGRMEVISYEGISGANLYPAARAPATGSLGIRIAVADIAAVKLRAEAAGIAVQYAGAVDLLFGRHNLVFVRSPGGLHVEVVQPELRQ